TGTAGHGLLVGGGALAVLVLGAGAPVLGVGGAVLGMGLAVAATLAVDVAAFRLGDDRPG
ncbi:hypothetical protein AN219_33640, partial [Streptomyces nanshensis]